MEAANPSSNPWSIDFSDGGFQTPDLVRNDLLAAIVPVILRSPAGNLSALGTAFCVGTLQGGYALYATARHAVECLKRAPAGTEPFVLVPQSMTNQDRERGLTGVRIESVGMTHPFSDAALLTVNFASSAQPVDYDGPKTLPLTLDRPKVGEHCMALGYSELDVGSAAQDGTRFTARQHIHGSRGTIEEVHPTARDAVLITFPSFRSDAFYASGMSGGPIFCQSGYVIGFVSSSYDASTGTAYGAHVATLTEISIDVPGSTDPIETTLRSLMQSGQMHWCDIGSSVTLERTDNGVTLRWPDNP